MNEVRALCRRVLGPGAAADAAAAAALTESDRIGQLAAAVRGCGARAAEANHPDASEAAEPVSLAAAVGRELATANGGLPERQRQVLALRELLGLSHREIATVLGLELAAVAPVLARARLGLRERRRGLQAVQAHCPERDRSLRLLAHRQDGEHHDRDDREWLLDHLDTCDECSEAHAAMLEASVCYRAWPPDADETA